MSIPYKEADAGLGSLKSAVSQALKSPNSSFTLWKHASNGSNCNLLACVWATNGNLDRMMIACGSYVAGHENGLEDWTTSHFNVQIGISSITHPDYACSSFAKEHTIGLPYHIPGVLDDDIIKQYEDKCFLELHKRCLLARCTQSPFKALLLELVMAGTGCVLSDCALTILGHLAKQHQFKIVLDEIMTGGRCGSLLLVEQSEVHEVIIVPGRMSWSAAVGAIALQQAHAAPQPRNVDEVVEGVLKNLKSTKTFTTGFPEDNQVESFFMSCPAFFATDFI